jgi:hypothetical protein
VDRIVIPERLSWRTRLVPNCLVSDLLPFLLQGPNGPQDRMTVT